MVSYSYQFKRNQIQEALMHNNVFENVIATLIVGALSTLIGFILRAFGFSTEESINVAALFALLGLAILFLVGRKLYSSYRRLLTALRNNSIIEFPNQKACESNIREACQNARKIKILTVRGEKYFQGARSLLRDLCLEKRGRGFSIEVLVLSPESQHITEELAESLHHSSAERTKRRMRNVLDNLRHMEEENENFLVKCYDGKPIFKFLLFDDIMFVSAIVGPKNDNNTKMLQITREGNVLFSGFEKYFDDLWKRCNRPS